MIFTSNSSVYHPFLSSKIAFPACIATLELIYSDYDILPFLCIAILYPQLVLDTLAKLDSHKDCVLASVLVSDHSCSTGFNSVTN